MPLTVRLSPKTERLLRALAKRRNASRSDVVREAIERYGATVDADTAVRTYDAWLDVIGIVTLGARDTHRTTGEQFTALVTEQARARRSR
jgi:predicted transcriptional regulator